MEQVINTKTRHPHGLRIVFWVCVGILAALFFSALFAVAVTFLWNWLMTDLFGLRSINYFQAFGLVLLARLLVGGWHRGHQNGEHSHFHGIFGKKDVPRFHEFQHHSDAFNEFWDKEGREAFKSFQNNREGEAR